VSATLGWLTYNLNHSQELLAKEQTNLKYVEIFYREIASDDLARQRMAFGVIKSLKRDIAILLLEAASMVNAEQAVRVANDIADDSNEDRSARGDIFPPRCRLEVQARSRFESCRSPVRALLAPVIAVGWRVVESTSR